MNQTTAQKNDNASTKCKIMLINIRKQLSTSIRKIHSLNNARER